MNSDEVKALRKKWGDKPCDHPGIIADQKTGKPLCIRCGRLVHTRDLAKPPDKDGGINNPPSAR
jgi:hypothetical protein